MSNYEGLTPEERAVMEEVERAEQALDDFLCGEIDQFCKQTIRTKAQLESSVEKTIAHFRQEATSDDKAHADVFYATLLELLAAFKRKINRSDFPEPLPDWWFYSYQISATGIRLFLNYLCWEAENETTFKYSSYIFSSLSFLDVPAKLIPVAEYAEKYGVEAVTVRQWIRRDKIRCAVKAGSEWRIPALFEQEKNRHYVPVEYVWDTGLEDIPEKYAFLNEMQGVEIYRDSANRRKFTVMPYNGDTLLWGYINSPEDIESRKAYFSRFPGLIPNDEGCIVLEPKEREELELYLIANPIVKIKTRGSGNGYSWRPDIGVIGEYGKEYSGEGATLSFD